ncbi:MAG: hypothetical protein IPL53_20500 [Ignavibacteria bacterium]|nr:hypothetical protein [Ignavibacteria bacterium]
MLKFILQTIRTIATIQTIRTTLTLFTLFTQHSYSQWQWQNPLPQGNILFGSYYLSSNTGWACGDGGTIIKTTDSGNNWVINTTQTKQSIRSVFFVNENTGFACGLYGTVLKSTNGGNIWDKVVLNTTGNLFSVRFLNSTTGFIVGDTGIVFKTSNGGINWSRRTTNVVRTLTSCAARDSIVLSAGLNGTLVRSSDYGETFQIINPNNTNFLFDVMFKDANTAFIAGAYGTILRSVNAGLSWSEHQLPLTGGFIQFRSEMTIQVSLQVTTGTYTKLQTPDQAGQDTGLLHPSSSIQFRHSM